MEIPELKADLHRTLLGPLSLANEIFGALLPGCVFTILLSVKRGWVNRLLSYPLLGYKTKIVIALFASYIAGKVVLSVVTLIPDIRKLLQRRAKRKKAKTAKPAQATNLLQSIGNLASSVIDQSPDYFEAFLGGLVAGPALNGKFQALEHFSAYEAGTVFHLSTGLVFLLSAAIPGDGSWRVLEGLLGAILLARGIRSWYARSEFLAGFMGAMLNEYLTSLQPGQLSAKIKSIWDVLTVLSNTPASPTTKPVPPTPAPVPVPPAPEAAAPKTHN